MNIKAALGFLVFPLISFAFWSGDGDHVGNGGGLAELTLVKTYADLQTLRPLCENANLCKLSDSDQSLLKAAKLDWKIFFQKEIGAPLFEQREEQLFFSSRHLYQNGFPLPTEQLVEIGLRAFFSRETKNTSTLRGQLGKILLESRPLEQSYRDFRFYFSPRSLVSDFFVVDRKEDSVDLAKEMSLEFCGASSRIHLSRIVYREIGYHAVEVVGRIEASCSTGQKAAKFQLSVGEKNIKILFWNVREI